MKFKNNFITTYGAVIITKEDHTYFIKKDDNSKWGLPGCKVSPLDDKSPREAILEYINNIFKIQFNNDWLKYIGVTYHENQIEPESYDYKEQFVVMHYWLNLNPIINGWYLQDHTKFTLEEVSKDDGSEFYEVDILAAKRILDFIRSQQS